jgi:hypothetical protein
MASNFFAFYIEKSTPWRGETQHFGNLYHYGLTTDEPSTTMLEDMINTLKAAEVPVHSTDVKFEVARSWGPVNPDGKGGSMRVVKPLTGTGSASPTTDFYKELAFLVTFPLGRYGSRNRPQFLRKWIHACSYHGLALAERSGNTKFSTIPTPLTTYGNAVKAIPMGTGGAPTSLASPKDHLADQVVIYPYLEHRQFG